MAEEKKLIFREVQSFPLWLRLAVAFSMGFAVVIDFFALHKMLSQQNLPKPFSIASLIICGILLPMAIATLFLLLKMQTKVHSDGLYVRFFPFHIHYKKFTADDISECFARTYKPIREYGGWGIRCGFRSGRAYNVSGNKGVQLVLKNGKRLLIGSQKSELLAEAVSSFIKST
ncbi:MAG: hypothetical protein JSV82_09075 [Planctomycetota bacterium]|nr:MAG: hypothetical protein JSV82_09075 [Planctomycetota bacterium]